MKKNLAIIIKANQEYIRYSDDELKQNKAVLANLFESISETYIPLLNILENLQAKNISFRIGLVLPPVLCSLLNSEKIQQLYIEWLDNKNLLGLKELESAQKKDSPEKVNLIKFYIEKNDKIKKDFVEKYQCNLIAKFSDFRKKGLIELLATCGTDIFIPHYFDYKEVISAQIETGLHAYRQCFGEIPDGFWIPELGYTNGLEKLIRAYGYSYTVLSARSFLLANEKLDKGIFYPVRTDNSLVVFSNDPETDSLIYGEDGFSANTIYRNENEDIGFINEISQLSPLMEEGSSRFATGFKYRNKESDNSFYNIKEAIDVAKKDAETFLKFQAERLNKAAELLSDSDFVSLVCTFDLDKLRQNWSESLNWIEEVITKAQDFDLNIESCDKMIDKQFSLQKLTPYYAAANGAGYGEDLLSNENSWMMRYTTKACQRMVDLADRFPNDTGLKARLLNMGAKEVMIAMSSGLAKMMNDNFYPEYAEERFKQSIIAFTMVFDSLGSNTVSTEWLTTLETKDSLFPWMNYRIFSHKI